jgi:hypothetical protein
MTTRSHAEEIAGETLSAIELAAVVLIGLLVCPPLAILVVVVVVPVVVIALVLGLLAAVLATPYLLVHHLRGHRGGHAALAAHRLRHAGRALRDLLPHRIVADARRADAPPAASVTARGSAPPARGRTRAG